MNKQLQDFARKTILEGLSKLPESNQMFFKQLYSHNNLKASIEDVVAKMSDDKLDGAMQQIENTLNKGNQK